MVKRLFNQKHILNEMNKVHIIAITLLIAITVIYVVTAIYAKNYVNDVLRVLEFIVTAIVFYYFGKKLSEKKYITESLLGDKQLVLLFINKELRILSLTLIVAGIITIFLNYVFRLSIVPIVEIIWIFIGFIIMFIYARKIV